ncbi:MAG: hypothetical protein ACXACY_31205 [Candidatus Hodarchaeales archaeon]|jgi:hypothetical protein
MGNIKKFLFWIFVGVLIAAPIAYAAWSYDPLPDLPGKFVQKHGISFKGPVKNLEAHCEPVLEAGPPSSSQDPLFGVWLLCHFMYER